MTKILLKKILSDMPIDDRPIFGETETIKSNKRDIWIFTRSWGRRSELFRLLEGYGTVRAGNDEDIPDATGWAFLDVNMGKEAIIQAAQNPNLILVVTGETIHPSDERYMKQNLGIRHFRAYPLTDDDVEAIFDGRKRDFVEPKELVFEQAGEGRRAGYSPRKEHVPVKHPVIAFHGAKGGVGKTTLSLFLAWNLSRMFGNEGKVILVDFDLQYGDVAALLDLEPRITCFDWVGLENEMTPRMVEDYVIRHPGGLYVLPAPENIAQEDKIDGKVAEKILSNLRKAFDVVVVDTGCVLRDSAYISFEHASRINIVTTLDKSSLRDTSRCLQDMQALGIPLHRIKVVFNQVRGDEGIPERHLKEGLELKGNVVPTLAVLPYDRQVFQSLNRGKVPEAGKKGFMREFQPILDDVLDEESGRNSAGWLKRLLG